MSSEGPVVAVPSVWQVEQVAAVAPSAAAFAAAQALAVPSRWSGAGCDDAALWGRCAGSGAEPYEVMVDHPSVRYSCSCPSRKLPCKHALALLLLWVRGGLPAGQRGAGVEEWVRRGVAAAPALEARPAAADDISSDQPTVPPDPGPPPDGGRDDRVARMRAGLVELRRWLEDRMRTGLADPSIGRYDTWETVAARLVDAQVGGLANRVRRIAGLAGASSDWHARILSELGVLALLVNAGLRLHELPDDLADSVAVALGWQVRQAAVLAGVPETDEWHVMGRSDTREDRIEVRRIWMRGALSGQWAMVLSFAAYGQSLDATLPVGSSVSADLLRYPGRLGLRALFGTRRDAPVIVGPPAVGSVADAAGVIGRVIAAEPWIDRYPFSVDARLTHHRSRWWLADHDAMLPLDASAATVAALAACTGGVATPISCEWTPTGVIPLTVHLADRHVDLGRVADQSFVGAA